MSCPLGAIAFFVLPFTSFIIEENESFRKYIFIFIPYLYAYKFRIMDVMNLPINCLISGFHREVLRTALFWVTTKRVVVISYRRFGTAYRSHLREPLKTRPIGCFETLIRNYHYPLRINHKSAVTLPINLV
jgi:hypothetical protein